MTWTLSHVEGWECPKNELILREKCIPNIIAIVSELWFVRISLGQVEKLGPVINWATSPRANQAC